MTENTSSGAPMITNLENAKIIGVDQIQRGLHGDIRYKSPEIIELKPYNQKADAWAFGIIVFLLASGGKYPFDSKLLNYDYIYDDIENKILNEQPEWSLIETRSSMLKDLLKVLLDRTMGTRPNISVVLKHKWFIENTKVAP